MSRSRGSRDPHRIAAARLLHRKSEISEQPARGAGDLARSLTALPFASEGSLRSPSRLAGRGPLAARADRMNVLSVSLSVYKGASDRSRGVYNEFAKLGLAIRSRDRNRLLRWEGDLPA